MFAIASSLRAPICIDSTSNIPPLGRSFGHYVRVLVDIDLLKELRDKILVERIGYAFFMKIEYEKILELCHFYKALGHPNINCIRKFIREDINIGKIY